MISQNWLNAALHRVPRTSYDWWRPWSSIASPGGSPQSGTGGPLAASPPPSMVGSGGPLQAPQAPGPGMVAPGIGTGGPYMQNPGAAPVVAAPAVGPSPAAGAVPTNAFNSPQTGPNGWLPSGGGGGNMATPEIIAATGHPIAAVTKTGFGIPINPALTTVSPYQLGFAR